MQLRGSLQSDVIELLSRYETGNIFDIYAAHSDSEAVIFSYDSGFNYITVQKAEGCPKKKVIIFVNNIKISGIINDISYWNYVS